MTYRSKNGNVGMFSVVLKLDIRSLGCKNLLKTLEVQYTLPISNYIYVAVNSIVHNKTFVLITT